MAPKQNKKSPISIEIGKGSRKASQWKVGKSLGFGACAEVHELVTIDGAPTEYAIKLAVEPTKKTKKGNSPAEVNERLIDFERLLYQNQFPDLQGVNIPNLPPGKGPPASGVAEGESLHRAYRVICSCQVLDHPRRSGSWSQLKVSPVAHPSSFALAGYRFLVLEKMAAPLTDVPGILARASSSSGKIPFGKIAARLLEIVQSIHDRNHLVIDMKSDNFMLAFETPKSKMKKSNSVADDLASKLRILDLALMQNRKGGTGQHRPNDGSRDIVGTPLFASLNVHDGSTPSRRDDLESLGYVIAQLLIQINSNNVEEEGALPWSSGKSDEEVGKIKKAQVNDPKSAFYSILGDAKVGRIFREYMDEVMGYSYSQSPDYESLLATLQSLDVTLRKDTTKKKVAGKPVPAKGTKRVTRSQSQSKDNSSPNKVARTAIKMDSADDDECFDAVQGDETTEMDWEPTRDENEDPDEDERKPPVTGSVGVIVFVQDGPDTGLTVELIKGGTESVVVGTNPISKSNESAMVIAGDAQVDPSHVRLKLKVAKKFVSVNVSDLNSSGTFIIGGDKIKKGKDCRLFLGSSLRIGETSISIKKLA